MKWILLKTVILMYHTALVSLSSLKKNGDHLGYYLKDQINDFLTRNNPEIAESFGQHETFATLFTL